MDARSRRAVDGVTLRRIFRSATPRGFSGLSINAPSNQPRTADLCGMENVILRCCHLSSIGVCFQLPFAKPSIFASDVSGVIHWSFQSPVSRLSGRSDATVRPSLTLDPGTWRRRTNSRKKPAGWPSSLTIFSSKFPELRRPDQAFT